MAEITEDEVIKSVLHPGRWQKLGDLRCWNPRPTLLTFANPLHRNRFLDAADMVKTNTRCDFTTESGDTATSKIKANNALRASPVFNTAWLQDSKCRIQKYSD